MEVAAGINNGSIKEIIQKEAAMEILQKEFCLNQQYASLFSGICSAKKPALFNKFVLLPRNVVLLWN